MNMLERIQSRLDTLSKSERKVAEIILAAPAQAIHSSIATLAQQAAVSEPTVNRFCRSMETRGFPILSYIWRRASPTVRPTSTATLMKMIA